MRYQRLIIESGSNAVTVRFHPKLTLITNVTEVEREGLKAELLGALDGSRRNVHIEILEDTGRRLAFLRGRAGEPDRVLDVVAEKEVTNQFVTDDNRVDLAATLGLDAYQIAQLSIMNSADFAVLSEIDETVLSLAKQDQLNLWSAADEFVEARKQLVEISQTVGTTREDGLILDEIERRHANLENAFRSHEIARHYSIFIGTSCMFASIPGALMNKLAGLAFLAVAAITTTASIVTRRRMEKARKAEETALAAAGAHSYMAFHLQRVGSILKDEEERRKLTDAAAREREAEDAWKKIANDIPVDWALNHMKQIEAAALSLEDNGSAESSETVSTNVNPAELARALVQRISELRTVGHGSEGIPLILDEPLIGLDRRTKTWVLDLIARSAGSLQVVLMTNDPEVITWGKRQQIAGDSTMIEPAPRHATPARHLTVVA